MFGGSMTSDSFFETLQSIQSGDKTEFRTNGHVVRFFPDVLTIEIVAIPVGCDGSSEYELSPDIIQLMDRLIFSAKWKGGVVMTPVDHLNYLGARHSPQDLPLGGSEGAAEMWRFKMTVGASGVQLKNDLIFFVTKNDGSAMVRMALRL